MHSPIQIVNKKGVFLGIATDPKEAMVADQIRLVSRVILKNDNGEYLLQKRADDMFIYPGFWDSSAAGHVDEGETPIEAAYRELVEEVGISDIDLVEIGQHYNEMEERSGYISKIFSHIFIGKFTGDIKNLKLEPAEVTRVEWFSKHKILNMINNGDKVTAGVKLIFNEVL